MLRIAIVEDEAACADRLAGFLQRYQQERNTPCHVSQFKDGVDFLEKNACTYDVIFMDIEMPHMDGMKAAARLREMDTNACLIFVTNMAQWAIRGYEVSAMDFLVKPVPYQVFAYKLDKAVSLMEKRRGEELILKTKDGLVRMLVSDLYYVEVDQHRVFYHGAQGVFEAWGSLSQAEKQLAPHGFARCNACYLVNLRYVKKVENGFVFLGDTQLEISRGKRKAFMQELTQFLGV